MRPAMQTQPDTSPARAIDPAILDEAADWLMQLHDSQAGDKEREACERWRQRSPEHARAWARAELLMHKLGGLPAALAMPALNRPASASRRASVLKLAALLAVLPGGLVSWRVAEEQAWTADYRSATGERRELRLADGSQVTLNSGTALDVRFDREQRLLRLRRGEILVQTAAQAAGTAHRPFRVLTGEGQMEALGTRFSVQQQEGRTALAVLEGAVRVEPRLGAASAAQIVHAGQQVSFNAREMSMAEPVDETAVAWRQGMLLADKMRLDEFVAELSRYRGGLLRLDPAIADMRISGAFPVDDTDRALVMLVSTYPIEALSRVRGYWVTLVPR